MAEFRKLPTQAELQQMLFMESMRTKTPQEIAQENLAKGTTIKPIPENVFQKIAGGARTAGEFVNRAGTAADVAKLFPGYTGQSTVNIPTSFNFAPKQAPTGEIIPGGLQTQPIQVNQLLQAIKPADVLGISGAERAYTDVGLGKAPQPLDVLDVAGLGAIGYGAGKTALKATRGIPVGLSIQEAKGLLQTAPKSDIGFYSAVEQAALATPRKSGTGQAFLNDISKGQDVRADEIKWMGLDEFLKGKQNVTRQEVQDYIANNRVDVQEVQLGSGSVKSFEQWAADQGFGLEAIRDFGPTLRNSYEAFKNNASQKIGAAKFAQWQLPGGENYRELLLTMPSKEPAMPKGYEVTSVQYDDGTYRYFAETPTTRSAAYKTEEDAKAELQRMVTGLKGFRENLESFRSSHFDQPNILAHLRVNDRIDADGKKMLLIEEVQSDWHQAGRDKGYKGQLTSLPDDYFVSEMQNKAGDTVYEIRKTSNPNVIINRDYNRQSAINGAINTLNETVMGVPDAPFKDTWYQLALKRAIQHAAENGYDRIGLTTGSQQAARFDLSREIDEINVVGRTNAQTGEKSKSVALDTVDGRSIRLGVAPDGTVDNVNDMGMNNLLGKNLNEIVGKELAKKIMEGGSQTIAGEGLKVGGEGMKKYYDEIYPKFLDKYGKKWGARVGETKIKVGEDVVEGGMLAPGIDFVGESKVTPAPMETIRYIDITPEMKAGVSKGQPLFMAAPIGVGLLGSESMTPER